jgi:nitroreductase
VAIRRTVKRKEHRVAEFFDLLKKRRSIRDFDEKQVPLKFIRKIIKDSCLAPSAGNGQPWRFIIVKNKQWIQRLSDESKKNFLSYLQQNPDTPIKQYEAALRNKEFNVFYNAPCLVYILGPDNIESAYVDCTLAACYFMFCAAAMGLGTCWVGLGSNIRDPEILRAIGIPDDHRIVAPIVVGHPKTIPPAPHRKEPQILNIIS